MLLSVLTHTYMSLPLHLRHSAFQTVHLEQLSADTSMSKSLLTELFVFNHKSNERMIDVVLGLDQHRDEGIRVMSHLINSQNKWLARLQLFPVAPDMDWWLPVYPAHQLKEELAKCNEQWLAYLGACEESDLDREAPFVGHDGTQWASRLRDIALQLVFHSFHHRAQLQMLIREEGLQPDFIDYIGAHYRKLS